MKKYTAPEPELEPEPRQNGTAPQPCLYMYLPRKVLVPIIASLIDMIEVLPHLCRGEAQVVCGPCGAGTAGSI